MAAVAFEPLVLSRQLRVAGAAVPGLWDVVEHLRHARPLSVVRSPVALDRVPQMSPLVASHRLVRGLGARALSSALPRLRRMAPRVTLPCVASRRASAFPSGNSLAVPAAMSNLVPVTTRVLAP